MNQLCATSHHHHHPLSTSLVSRARQPKHMRTKQRQHAKSLIAVALSYSRNVNANFVDAVPLRSVLHAAVVAVVRAWLAVGRVLLGLRLFANRARVCVCVYFYTCGLVGVLCAVRNRAHPFQLCSIIIPPPHRTQQRRTTHLCTHSCGYHMHILNVSIQVIHAPSRSGTR